MSHFTVVVIGNDVDGQLEPYDENTSVEPYWRHEAGSPDEWYIFNQLREKNAVPADADMRTTLAAAIRDGWAESEDYRVSEVGELEYRSTYNPLSKWDWWVIGGRWEGFFLHIDGSHVDQILKQDWDLLGQRFLARTAATVQYDTLERITKGLPHPGRFSSWVERYEVDMPREEALARARAEYHEHPYIKALAGEEGFMPWMQEVHEMWCLDEENPRESYITGQMLHVGVPFAYVKDGEWHESGQMGWFGMSHNDMDPDAWAAHVSAVYDSLDDEMLTNCDCHI